jgi:serine/threonine-protein kinase HipA
VTRSVSVWFDECEVGAVRVDADGAPSFAYAESWLGAPLAFPLSTTMPLGDREHPAETVAPWLANLLPEETPLAIMSRALGVHRADAVALLTAVGGDTAGALSFGAPTRRADRAYAPLTDFYGIADPTEALARHVEDLETRPFLVGEDGVRVSLAGGQSKSALAVLDADGRPVLRLPRPSDRLAIPLHGAPSTVILKPDNPHLPGIVENETYCLTLAAAIGIAAVEATILSAGRRKAICVLRYDRRVEPDGRIGRVHQEDFAQALGVPPARKYERGTVAGPSLAAILGVGRHVGPANALSLLDQAIFNILVANTDAHAKNYSLLHPPGGRPRLAPLYDVSTVLAWPRVVQYLAQNIAGRKRKPGDLAGRHWDAVARSAGYRPADLRRRVAKLVDALVAKRGPTREAVAGLPGCTIGLLDQAADLIDANALRIGGRLREV